jgi:hypothetical protein
MRSSLFSHCFFGLHLQRRFYSLLHVPPPSYSIFFTSPALSCWLHLSASFCYLSMLRDRFNQHAGGRFIKCKADSSATAWTAARVVAVKSLLTSPYASTSPAPAHASQRQYLVEWLPPRQSTSSPLHQQNGSTMCPAPAYVSGRAMFLLIY